MTNECCWTNCSCVSIELKLYVISEHSIFIPLQNPDIQYQPITRGKSRKIVRLAFFMEQKAQKRRVLTIVSTILKQLPLSKYLTWVVTLQKRFNTVRTNQKLFGVREAEATCLDAGEFDAREGHFRIVTHKTRLALQVEAI